MDGASPLAQLVQQVLNLLRQILVLPPDGVQLLHRLVPRRAQAEQLRALATASSVAQLLPAHVRACKFFHPTFGWPQKIEFPLETEEKGAMVLA